MSPDTVTLIFLWLCYFVIHSTLSSLAIKNWVKTHIPQIMPAYRIIYNIIAILTLAPIFWVGLQNNQQWLWHYSGGAYYLSNALALMALACFVYSLKYYNGSEFWGLQQLKHGQQPVNHQERLQISPLHRFVRHPWYSCILVLIWTRPMDQMTLSSALLISAYLFIGSRLEENKLICYHGPVYKDYQQQVPGLIPCPWRFLSAEQAQLLLDRSLSAIKSDLTTDQSPDSNI